MTIRFFYSLLIVGLTAAIALNCSTKHKEEEYEEWAEMDSFHTLMSDVFHPFRDSSNLAPAKDGAEALALEAEKWASAELPAKVNSEEVKEALQQLRADARTFADKIKSGTPDEELAPALTDLHDQFHAIMEMWYGGGEGHEHH